MRPWGWLGGTCCKGMRPQPHGMRDPHCLCTCLLYESVAKAGGLHESEDVKHTHQGCSSHACLLGRLRTVGAWLQCAQLLAAGLAAQRQWRLHIYASAVCCITHRSRRLGCLALCTAPKGSAQGLARPEGGALAWAAERGFTLTGSPRACTSTKVGMSGPKGWSTHMSGPKVEHLHERPKRVEHLHERPEGSPKCGGLLRLQGLQHMAQQMGVRQHSEALHSQQGGICHTACRKSLRCAARGCHAAYTNILSSIAWVCCACSAPPPPPKHTLRHAQSRHIEPSPPCFTRRATCSRALGSCMHSTMRRS